MGIPCAKQATQVIVDVARVVVRDLDLLQELAFARVVVAMFDVEQRCLDIDEEDRELIVVDIHIVVSLVRIDRVPSKSPPFQRAILEIVAD
jgi:hypothetical protein